MRLGGSGVRGGVGGGGGGFGRGLICMDAWRDGWVDEKYMGGFLRMMLRCCIAFERGFHDDYL